MDYDGNPPQIDINNEFVSVQYNDNNEKFEKQVYLFQRGTPQLNPNVVELFTVESFVVSQYSLWASLNDMPSSMLSITAFDVKVLAVQKPSLSGKFGASDPTGLMTVSASGMTGAKLDSSCYADI
jgi:hypothetical protein